MAKRSIERTRFVDDIARRCQPLGAVVERRWAAVHRHATGGSAQFPAGTCANVEFDTRFAGNCVVRELVSFRQDKDGIGWLSGYVLR